MAIISPVADGLYHIYHPEKGWLRFKYNGSQFKSVNRENELLDIYFFQGGQEKCEPLCYTQNQLNDLGYEIWSLTSKKNSIVTDPLLPTPKQVASRAMTANSFEMKSILNDPTAMVLYSCIEIIMPYMECMGFMSQSVAAAQAETQKVMLSKSQAMNKMQADMQRMIDEIRNSWFYKLITSPWSGLIIALSAIVITIIMAILVATGAGALVTIIFIATIFAVAILAAGTIALIGQILRWQLDDLREELGGKKLSKAMTKAFDDLKNMIGYAMIAMVATILLTVIVAMISGALAGVSAKASTAVGGSVLGTLMKSLGNPKSVKPEDAVRKAGGLHNAALSVFSSLYEMAFAGLREEAEIMKAKASQWEARSKYYGSFVKAFEESISNIMEYIEKMFKGQGALIKTLGDASLGITRNFTI